MNKIMQWFTAVLTCLVFTYAHAQTGDMQALVGAMKQGGYVIVFRHGATNRDQADTDPLNFDNIAKQRLLSEQGKRVAIRVWRGLQEAWYSAWQGLYEQIQSRGGDREPENERRAEALQKMAGTMPETAKNTLIVTHKPNIMDAFGKDWFDVKEGEASIFKPDGSGKTVLVARLQAVDWIKASGGN
jgi:hypothetical protein